MMAAFPAVRPACPRCLTRQVFLAQLPASAPFATAIHPSRLPRISTTSVQIRCKNTGRRGDSGIVVQLLQDIPQYGRRDTILRIDRGRMRNVWYPRGMADYVPHGRRVDVEERDPFFSPEQSTGSSNGNSGGSIEQLVRQTVSLQTIDPARAAELLKTLPPLVFQRKTISASPGSHSTSPSSPPPTSPPSPLPRLIFGSVSADEVAAALRATLHSIGGDAALVRVEGRDVRFVVDAGSSISSESSATVATADRVKALGRWEVDIAVHGGDAPVRINIEVVQEE